MKNIYIILTLISFQNLAFTQHFAQNYWNQGKVFLDSGDTLVGKIKYNLDNEVVQVQQLTLKTFSSTNILGFEFLDTKNGVQRYYYTLPFKKVSNYETPTFFELLKEGEAITLLAREDLETRTITNTNPYSPTAGMPFTTTRLKINLYFLYKNGRIKYYNNTKKALLLLLKDRERQIKEFIKQNNIKYDRPSDIIAIVNYYNKLKVGR